MVKNNIIYKWNLFISKESIIKILSFKFFFIGIGNLDFSMNFIIIIIIKYWS